MQMERWAHDVRMLLRSVHGSVPCRCFAPFWTSVTWTRVLVVHATVPLSVQ